MPNFSDVLRDLVRCLPTFDPAAPLLPQLVQFALWAGTFACLCLLVRMLITPWGDRNVTPKAILLSGLLHVLAGLWTTTIFLVPPIVTTDRPIALREVIASPDDSADAVSGSDSSRSESRPWEKLPELPGTSLRRTEGVQPVSSAELERTVREADLEAVDLPATTSTPETRENAPQLSGEDARLVASLPAEISGEQTASARDEIRTAPVPSRRKGAAALTAGESVVPARPASREGRPDEPLVSSLGFQPTLIDQPGRSAAKPEAVDADPDAITSPRMTPTERPTAVRGPVIPGELTSTEAPAPETSAGEPRRFQRTNRGSRRGQGGGQNPSGDLARLDSAPIPQPGSAQPGQVRRGTRDGEGAALVPRSSTGLDSRPRERTDSGPDPLSIETDTRSPVLRMVRGLVTDAETRQPLRNATIRIDRSSGKPLVVKTNAEGVYELLLPESADNFAVTATHSDYLPEAKNLRSVDLTGKAQRIDFSLRQPTANVIALEGNPEVHHLGNDQFQGSVNSQFQRKAEGTERQFRFTLTAAQFRSRTSSTAVTIFAKGVQCPPRILINGHPINTAGKLTPEDGSYALLEFPFDPNKLRQGLNTLTLQAVNCSGDLDDFEFVNVQLRLSRPAASTGK